MSKSIFDKLIFLILSLLCGASILLVLFLVCKYLHDRDVVMQNAKKQIHDETVKIAEKFDNEFDKFFPICESIANEISSGGLEKEQIIDRLENIINANSKVSGIGAAYVPYVIDTKFRRYSPYYIGKYDNKEIGRQFQIFSVPFYNQKHNGIVFIDVSLDYIKEMMKDSLKFGENGYGFVISKEGTFLYHPLDVYVNSNKTIFDLAKDIDSKKSGVIGQEALKGESGFIELIDDVTGKLSWIFIEPIRSGSIGAVFVKDELSFTNEKLRRQKFQIFIGIIASLLFLSSILFRIKER